MTKRYLTEILLNVIVKVANRICETNTILPYKTFAVYSFHIEFFMCTVNQPSVSLYFFIRPPNGARTVGSTNFFYLSLLINPVSRILM